MTTYFVHHGGNGLSPTTDPGTGGDWSGAYATITAATSAMSNGDIINVSNQHVGSTASAVFQNRGVNATPAYIVGVDHNDTSVKAAGAVETYSAHTYIYGAYHMQFVHLKVSGTNELRFMSTGFNHCYFKDCIFELIGSGSQKIIFSQSANAGRSLYRNCKFRFANAGHQLKLHNSSWIEFIGCSFADTGTVPTPAVGLFYLDGPCHVIVRDSDLQNITTKLVGTQGFNPQFIDFFRCHITTTNDFELINNGNQGSLHRRHDANGYFKEATWSGSMVRDLTVVKNGGVGFSAKLSPLVAFEMVFKVASFVLDLSANKTLTFEVAQYNAGGAPAALTADECKVLIEYPDGTLLGKVAESASIASSTQRWDDDLGSEITTNITKQKLSVTVPGTIGDTATVTALIQVAKANINLNVDPSPGIA